LGIIGTKPKAIKRRIEIFRFISTDSFDDADCFVEGLADDVEFKPLNIHCVLPQLEVERAFFR